MVENWADTIKEFDISQLNEFLAELDEKVINWECIKSKKIEYYNIQAAFDTETTSYKVYDEEKSTPSKEAYRKMAWIYTWQFGVDNLIIFGRTIPDFLDFISQLTKHLFLSPSRRLIVYVHNLGYDFQFIRKEFNWSKVFAVDNRSPIYAITGGIEFRDSYILANASLATVGKNLTRYQAEKMVGDLDYSLIRTPYTPLTPEELRYCLNDIKVLLCYIKEKIEDDGDITKIPLTNTGYVRNFVRDFCFDFMGKSRKKYANFIDSLRITSRREYEMLKAAFQGGFTHASCLYSGKLLEDVGSADEASAYPLAMCADYYPMSSAVKIDISQLTQEEFIHLMRTKCCLVTIGFYSIEMLREYETPLSYSRCHVEGEYYLNNGRIVSADFLVTTMTELDFDTVAYFYKWSSMQVLEMYVYERNYLPKPIIMATLELYAKKTELKGVDDKVVEYMISKNMINSVYGMMVTSIVRDEHVYDDEEGWLIASADTDKQLSDYNDGYNRFLFYAWGVWVTAHARHRLFSAIREFGMDYVYCDTDSIKGLNFDKHQKYFDDYNTKVQQSLMKMCVKYGIPFSKCSPKTKDGVPKPLGVWEREEDYSYFKTLGAKRYMFCHKTLKAGEPPISFTISGLNKKVAIPYLLEKHNGDIGEIFDEFELGFKVPAGYTGKNTLTYIDDFRMMYVTDYLGKSAFVSSKSSIHMEPQAYEMGIMQDYLKFLRGIQEVVKT